MNYELKGKVVVVAGGTQGIGEAIAHAYAEQGAKVAVCGRSLDKLEDIKASFKDKGYSLLGVQADMAVNADIQRFVDTVVSEYGRVDVWVNNTGINIQKPFHQLPEDEWHQVVDVNFKAIFYGTAFASNAMKKTGGGVVINSSSFNAYLPTAGRAIYCATKAAVENFSRVAAVELAKFNVRVVGVAPGYTITRLTEWEAEIKFDELVSAIPIRKLASVNDMVAAYLFLASDASSYINGVFIPVNGGKFGTQNPQWSWQQTEGSLD